MNPRVYLAVDPRTLRLPTTRPTGPDPFRLSHQVRQYGGSTHGMPTIEVSRGTDGELVINNGVTRATRVAMMAPGVVVRVEVIDDLPIPVGSYPAVGDFVP
jgi:hypothetical protein